MLVDSGVARGGLRTAALRLLWLTGLLVGLGLLALVFSGQADADEDPPPGAPLGTLVSGLSEGVGDAIGPVTEPAAETVASPSDVRSEAVGAHTRPDEAAERHCAGHTRDGSFL